MPVTIGGSGPITGVTSINTTVSDTELGYLDGVTSAIQTQLAGKADTTGNGAWTSWTPTLTASTTNPTLGTGGFTSGAYIQIGKIVIARFHIAFGSSGANAGSGNYRISIPVNGVVSTYSANGTAWLLDQSAANSSLSFARIEGNTYFQMSIDGTVNISNASPWTWANLDSIGGTITYEAA